MAVSRELILAESQFGDALAALLSKDRIGGEEVVKTRGVQFVCLEDGSEFGLICLGPVLGTADEDVVAPKPS